MKSLKMLLVAALTLLILPVYSQNNTAEFQLWQLTKSKKELMKMEVMKIKTNPKNFVPTTLKEGQVSNLSSKEQMKMSVMKLKPVSEDYNVAFNKSGKCTVCLKLSYLSLKEQMKMKVMGLSTHPINMVEPREEIDKCSICGIDLPLNK